MVIAWYALLGLSAILMVFHRCRISSCKKYIALPIVVESIGVLLWIWYYLRGGSSPRIMGISLFNIQEVILLQYIGIWESCIAIGLIPSRSLIEEKDWIRNSVFDTIQDEYDSARESYEKLWDKEGDAFQESLIHLSCLAAYAKRRCNLELIADSRGLLSTTELSLSIKETFDYYQLSGLSTGYEESGKADVPALLIIYAYQLFEKILQEAQSACYVKVYAGQTEDAVSFRMIVEADLGEEVAREGSCSVIDRAVAEMGTPEAIGAAISVREEDETETMELSAEYPLQNAFLANLWKKERAAEHGLAGIAGYLSLEGEALKVKTWIHDSLGRCLLMTKRAILCPGEVDRETLHRAWDRFFAGITAQVEAPFEGKAVSAAKLRKERQPLEGASPDSFSEKTLGEAELEEAYPECFAQSGSMGVNPILRGRIPADERYISIIDTAISVHVTNVSGHTTGDEAYITVTEDGEGYTLVFENNGESKNVDAGEIREGGGLRNLRRKVEAAGGTMEIESKPRFRMTLRLMR